MKETEEEQVQEKPLPEFDEAELRTLWGSSAHKAMVTSGVGGYKTMYAAAAYPDSKTKETNPLKRDRRFHGVGHYLLTMKFLVNLAHEYYLKDKGNWQEVYQWADSDSRILAEDIRLEKTYDNKYDINMVKEIKWFLNQRIRTDISAAEENTRHNKAYKIMGVAIHLAGDIYAHRSRVTPAMLENAKSVKNIKNKEEAEKVSEQYRNAGYFVISDFKDWKGFVRDVKNGVVTENGLRYIEFRHLTGTASPNGRYLKDNIKIRNQPIKGNELYEDNPKIQKWRYNDARSVVEDLIGSNTDYNFRTHEWNVKVMRSLHRLRGSKITN